MGTVKGGVPRALRRKFVGGALLWERELVEISLLFMTKYKSTAYVNKSEFQLPIWHIVFIYNEQYGHGQIYR
jgi:hypothetical protein